jgi:hypothetical protein
MALNDKFRSEFKKIVAKAKSKNELFFSKLIVEADKRLVAKSPVDTGRFKSNWRVGNGGVNTLTTASTGEPNNAPEINSIKINGQTIHLTNSLPYAHRLEYGWSKQAPSGMVRLTLTELQGVARQIGAELRLV